MTPFSPSVDLSTGHASASLALSAASNRVALPVGPDYLLTLEGDSGWIRFGSSTVVATGSEPGDIRVPAGGSMVIRCPGGGPGNGGAVSYLAGIGSGTLHIVGGIGS